MSVLVASLWHNSNCKYLTLSSLNLTVLVKACVVLLNFIKVDSVLTRSHTLPGNIHLMCYKQTHFPAKISNLPWAYTFSGIVDTNVILFPEQPQITPFKMNVHKPQGPLHSHPTQPQNLFSQLGHVDSIILCDPCCSDSTLWSSKGHTTVLAFTSMIFYVLFQDKDSWGGGKTF